jgi:hypothetical protein
MSDDDTRELKDYERAVPITAFNLIESKLHRAEQRLREGRVVDAHEEVTDAHRELSKHKEGTDDELVTDGGQPDDEEPRWRFEWSNIRDGCGVFVR